MNQMSASYLGFAMIGRRSNIDLSEQLLYGKPPLVTRGDGGNSSIDEGPSGISGEDATADVVKPLHIPGEFLISNEMI